MTDTEAVAHWIDVQIADGRDEDWIAAMLPKAAVVICGNGAQAALDELLQQARA